MANKWVLIIISTLIGILLGGILEDHVCEVAKQDLGSATSLMKATCVILSIPIDWIILIVAVLGLMGYLIWDYNN
ncbi:MAG: hypothetical protein AABY07_10175 [Nanoarchaeota archaeon]